MVIALLRLRVPEPETFTSMVLSKLRNPMVVKVAGRRRSPRVSRFGRNARDGCVRMGAPRRATAAGGGDRDGFRPPLWGRRAVLAPSCDAAGRNTSAEFRISRRGLLRPN